MERKIPKTTRHPRLLEERNYLIRLAYYDHEYFIPEIAEIFRTSKATIGKVVFESKTKPLKIKKI